MAPVLAATLIIVVVVMAFRGVKLRILTAVMVSFFLAALLLDLPGLKKIRLGILEAELQDRIQAADATINQLRAIATFSVKETLLSYVDSESDGPGARKRVFEQRDVGLKLLRDLGATDDQQADAVSLFNITEAKLLAYDIDIEALKLLKADQDKVNDYVDMRQKTFPDYYYSAPSADKLKEFVVKYVKMTPELDEDFQDLAYFQANGELRRPEVFFGRTG